MRKQISPYRRGLRKYNRLQRLYARIDSFMASASSGLGMCGERREGRFWRKWNKFSKRFANLFWTECPCCLFYRGCTIGAGAALLFGGACALIIWSLCDGL